MKARELLLVLTALSLGTSVHAAPVLIGEAGSFAPQDCVPFGCAVKAQFIYGASNFTGPITIAAITFFNSNNGDFFDTATYQFKLSTTTASVGSPSATFSNNVGTNEQLFAVASLSGIVPPAFAFIGTPFYYNPAIGNLLLEVDKSSGAGVFSASAFTDYDDGAGFLVSRVFSFEDSVDGLIDLNDGPVTEFRSLDDLTVPEPSTLNLTGLGLLAVGHLAARTRRKKLA